MKEGNKKLNEIFKLNIIGTHAMIIGQLVLISLYFAILIFLIIISIGALCYKEKAELLIIPLLTCFPYIIFIAYGLGTTNLILFIILFIRYYIGDQLNMWNF